MLPLDDPNLPWLETLVGVPILEVYFWCTNQFVVQRVLGARSIADARWGALFAGFLKLPALYIVIMPGVMSVEADGARGDAAYQKCSSTRRESKPISCPTSVA